jgi:hypothetical protein
MSNVPPVRSAPMLRAGARTAAWFAVAAAVAAAPALRAHRPRPVAASASLGAELAAPVLELTRSWLGSPPPPRSVVADVAVVAVVRTLDALDAARLADEPSV